MHTLVSFTQQLLKFHETLKEQTYPKVIKPKVLKRFSMQAGSSIEMAHGRNIVSKLVTKTCIWFPAISTVEPACRMKTFWACSLQ